MSSGLFYGGIFILCFGIALIFISVLGSAQISNGNLSEVSNESTNIIVAPFFYVGIFASIFGIVIILLGIAGFSGDFGGSKRG